VGHDFDDQGDAETAKDDVSEDEQVAVFDDGGFGQDMSEWDDGRFPRSGRDYAEEAKATTKKEKTKKAKKEEVKVKTKKAAAKKAKAEEALRKFQETWDDGGFA